jgi:hypothetical protein
MNLPVIGSNLLQRAIVIIVNHYLVIISGMHRKAIIQANNFCEPEIVGQPFFIEEKTLGKR